MPKYGYPSEGASKGISKSSAKGCLDLRVKLSDVGTISKPKGAPPPSSKGSIKHPEQVGKGSK